jgi:hypothetical protein
MSKNSNGKPRGSKPARGSHTQNPVGYKLGWRDSTHISKIEGQVMSRDMQDTFVMFDQTNMTAEQRRMALREKYGKSV